MHLEDTTAQIQYVGWDHDFRYAEERNRVTEHIQNIAREKGFSYALVQSVRTIEHGSAHTNDG